MPITRSQRNDRVSQSKNFSEEVTTKSSTIHQQTAGDELHKKNKRFVPQLKMKNFNYAVFIIL